MMRPMYPSTSRMHPLTIATVKPMKRLERWTWIRKEHSEKEKRAKKVALAGRDGRSDQSI